ncbi:60S ribosomal protein L14-like isoform X1 [Biomphalaria glabrata]|uniref:Large ribosomal subunit protein eL14 n=1 Tax=Biomphalaria glabrata TaxID=6526 RepID=A0A9W3AUN0_BIOGL|nr:60S ribosomal protein L14-like isoform X1 [Biomphalaria glabrata]
MALDPYSRFVEIGRVAYIAHGADKGKLIAIVDVIDQNRALVDGPCSGVGRKDMNFKALHLTPYTIKINHSARTGTVKKAWEAAEVNKKWEQSTWAKKLATAKRRTELTDFERFKLMKAKQARNRLINIEFGKLRKQARKAPAKPKKLKKKAPAKAAAKGKK